MKHLSFRYRRRRNAQEQREFCAAQSGRIAKRWAKAAAAREGEPIRETRVVEMTIRDSHRPMRIVRLQAEETERGWSRWTAHENGQRAGQKPWGKNAIARAIARTL
jgi:hypothetical protein